MADVIPVKKVPGGLAEFGATDKVPAENLPATEWVAETVSQAEAEAGTATTRRAWTAQRVAQAVRGAVLTGLSTASAAAVTATDSVLGAMGKLQAQISGLSTSKLDANANAVSATKLATARTINGVPFDGTSNITAAFGWGHIGDIPAVGNVNTNMSPGLYYYNSAGGSTGAPENYGSLLVTSMHGPASGFPGWASQTFFSTSGRVFTRISAAANPTTAAHWTPWRDIFDAATATKLATARAINGVSFDGTANITVSDATKLPLAGGAMTGTLITKITGHAVGHGGGDGSLSVRGDTNSAAVMSFHRLGAYAINLGLDTDDVFRLGGWSNGTNVYRFQVDGIGNFTANGNVASYSDIRLKKDIRVIPDALAKVEQLSGVTYERIDSGERQTGLIAQEVQKVLPEAVMQSDEYLSVAYGNMVGLLVEAIKELRAEVADLRSQVGGV